MRRLSLVLIPRVKCGDSEGRKGHVRERKLGLLGKNGVGDVLELCDKGVNRLVLGGCNLTEVHDLAVGNGYTVPAVSVNCAEY